MGKVENMGLIVLFFLVNSPMAQKKRSIYYIAFSCILQFDELTSVLDKHFVLNKHKFYS